MSIVVSDVWLAQVRKAYGVVRIFDRLLDHLPRSESAISGTLRHEYSVHVLYLESPMRHSCTAVREVEVLQSSARWRRVEGMRLTGCIGVVAATCR